MTGPLRGVRIIEFAGIGPCPFAAMALADAGADVIRIDRPLGSEDPTLDEKIIRGRARNIINRGRRSVAVDLKREDARDFVLELASHADGTLEGFRPGVMERLGLGSDVLLQKNSKLTYGRVTGWGRTGPYSAAAGHDIDYIALSGTLGAIGPANCAPVPPLNLIGDFGGGGLLLAYGMVCALLEASRSGIGQVVDVSMVDGSAYLASYIHGMRALGLWNDTRSSNILDGGAPNYHVYATKDNEYVAVGAVEERFIAEMLRLMGLDELKAEDFRDRNKWEMLENTLAGSFASRTRDEWERLFTGTDACVAPVLSLGEAPRHSHNISQETFVEVDGVIQPAPAPRFSRTNSTVGSGPPELGHGGRAALADWGISQTQVSELIDSRAIFAY